MLRQPNRILPCSALGLAGVLAVANLGCAYKEPATGALVRIQNPHPSNFDISVDGKRAGKIAASDMMLVRVTPGRHKIEAKNAVIIPAGIFWYWNIKEGYWMVDGAPHREKVEARLAGHKPMPHVPEEADIPLVLDKYYQRKGWIFIY